MMRQSGFSIFIGGSTPLFILFLILIALFSFYIYRFTIPRVSGRIKYLLFAIRFLILALILFVIYEPVLTLINREVNESKTFIYADNSNSIAAKDSSKRSGQVKFILDELNTGSGIRTKNFSFGAKIDSAKTDGELDIDFKEPLTNFSKIIQHIRKNSGCINSAVIISDGIITDGVDPSYYAERLQVPVFTIGIGDTTRKRDIEITDVLFNQFVYAGRPAQIEAVISNFGFADQKCRITLSEENKIIASEEIVLDAAGVNRAAFNYKPASGGEKKLTLSIAPLPGEYSSANNSRTFFLNVIDAKIKICIVAGAPSADLAAVNDALSADKNLRIKKLVQISQNKFLNDESASVIDSAEILFLLDFPQPNSSPGLIEKVLSSISKNKPFFFLLSANADLSKYASLAKYLPFTISKNTNESIAVQPELNAGEYSSYFSSANSRKELWDKLPPVLQINGEIKAKPGSTVLASTRIKNVVTGNSLIISSDLGGSRVFSILASDIWRWQLQTAESNQDFFPNFMNEIVKWLSLSDHQSRFRITTNKKIYSPGEEVIFSAQLYDQTMTPVDTAKIDLNISHNSKISELTFISAGNGIYTSSFNPSEPGDYKFTGKTNAAGLTNNAVSGRFSIDEIPAEKIDTRMREAFLKSLAIATGGNYYSIENHSQLAGILKKLNANSSKESFSKKEYSPYRDEWILALIVLLFSSEWFIRKRTGMI